MVAALGVKMTLLAGTPPCSEGALSEKVARELKARTKLDNFLSKSNKRKGSSDKFGGERGSKDATEVKENCNSERWVKVLNTSKVSNG